MTGFDLPEECPECGCSSGWYVDEDYSISISGDGSVQIGLGNNTRWGQKIGAKCNNRSCDAVVDIYIEAEAVNNSDVESAGSIQLIERLEGHDLMPDLVEKQCQDCGETFMAQVEYRVASDGGVQFYADACCGCNRELSFLKDSILHLEPDDVREKADILPQIEGENL